MSRTRARATSRARACASVVVVLALAMTGCGGSADPEPRTTAAGPVESSTGWDLLYISDSSGWGVTYPYADLASTKLGRPVHIVDWQKGGLSMREALDMVQDRPEVVAEAEIIVLWGNPRGLPVKPGFEACLEAEGDPGPYSVEDWAPFEEAIGQTLDAIWVARKGQPTVLRVTDQYVPVYVEWKQAGIYDACRQMWDTLSQAVRSAAEEHGATFVSAYDVYNGANHEEDPVDKGFISDDGLHPSEAGARAMAEALAATGFEPAADRLGR